MSQNRPVQAGLAIAVGAVPGAIGRFYVSKASEAIFGQTYYGTIAVNLLGCFLIAWVITLHEERFQHWQPEVRLALTTGFCGAFTTFSTYGLETVRLLEQGNEGLAIVYWGGSAIGGLVGVGVGVTLGRWGRVE